MLYRINANVDLLNTRVTAITVNTIGTYEANDINVFRLWYASSPSAQGIELASVSSVSGFGESLVFDGFDQQILAGTTGYFFIRVDASPTSTVDEIGRTVGIAQTAASSIEFAADVTITGSDPLAAGSLRAIVNRQDANSEVVTFETIDMPAGGTISSLSTTVSDETLVYNFFIVDNGTSDGLQTIVTNIRLVPGLNNNVDWASHIGGVSIKNSDNATFPIETLNITSSSIDISFLPGDFVIEDEGFVSVNVFIWLSDQGQLIDNGILSFIVPADHMGGFAADDSGSLFAATFASESIFDSQDFTIDVEATQLEFVATPLDADVNTDFAASMRGRDIYGNIDLDPISEAISFTTGLGDPASLTSPVQSFVFDATIGEGTYTWSDFQYADNFIITLEASADGFATVESDFIRVGTPFNLIVTRDLTLTESLEVSGYVEIQSGNTLTLESDVELSVVGDFTNDGNLAAANGSTILFNGTAGQQVIAGNALTIYNLTLDANADVLAETNINLINSLKLNEGSTFDADGASGNRNFTLISNASGTARIARVEDGASLSGEVIWQRYIPSGPAGYRHFGVPIKGARLVDISDDVNFQGIAGSFPNAWTNIYYYDEPAGADPENQIRGWLPYSSLNDNLSIANGNLLYIYNSGFANGAITMDIKGEPFIGNGTTSNGTLNIPLSITSGAFAGGGWHNLSNPYPAVIDWDEVYSTSSGIANFYQVWNPNTTSYFSYAAGVGIGDVDRLIASGQAFFVRAIDPGAEINFSESIKEDEGNANAILRKGIIPDVLKMRITSDKGLWDELAVRFTAESTESYDRFYDAPKLNGSHINLSSISADNRNLSINASGELKGAKSIKVNTNPVYFGNYEFTFSNLETFPEGTEVLLLDHYLDITELVDTSFTYNFSVKKDIAESYGRNRFELVFMKPALLIAGSNKVKPGENVEIPIFATGLDDSQTASFTFEWDENTLIFESVQLPEGMGYLENHKVEGNTLTVDIDHISGLFPEIDTDVPFLLLNFKSKHQISEDISFRFATDEMRPNIKTVNGFRLPVRTENSVLSLIRSRQLAGIVSAPNGQMIPGVSFKLVGNEDQTLITDSVGAFNFMVDSDQTYVLEVDNTSVNLPIDLDVSDVFLLRKHLLKQKELLNPYALISADFNQSGYLSTMDVAEMQSTILGIPGFKPLSWKVVPKQELDSSDPFNYMTNMQIDPESDRSDFSWLALPLGKISAFTSYANGKVGQTNWEWYSKFEYLPGGIVRAHIHSSEIRNIAAYQFSLAWNKEDLEFLKFTTSYEGLHINSAFVDNGAVSALWVSEQLEGVDIGNEDLMFTLEFKRLNSNSIPFISLSDTLTKSISYNNDIEPVQINLNKIANEIVTKYVLEQNYPNPFEEETNIRFELPNDEEVTLSVFSSTGLLLYRNKEFRNKGVHVIELNKKDFNSHTFPGGLYIYKVETAKFVGSKKMIIK
ncbi:MAG: T9SS type A sorting domain-containing protein [Cyclobacteriaceae bacterium]